MRARSRHLNPKDAGAILVLDARRITGLSSGASVSTWNDLSGNGRNATQVTSSKQPIFQTPVQGGQPSVQFNSANRQWLGGSLVLNSTQAVCVSLFNLSSGSQAYARILTTASGSAYDYNSVASTTFHMRHIGTSSITVTRPGLSLSPIASAYATPILASTVFNGSTCAVRLNGVQQGSAASSGTFNADAYRCGYSINVNDIFGPSDHFSGDQFCHAVFNGAPATSLLRRIEQAAAFSFKIACS